MLLAAPEPPEKHRAATQEKKHDALGRRLGAGPDVTHDGRTTHRQRSIQIVDPGAKDGDVVGVSGQIGDINASRVVTRREL